MDGLLQTRGNTERIRETGWMDTKEITDVLAQAVEETQDTTAGADGPRDTV